MKRSQIFYEWLFMEFVYNTLCVELHTASRQWTIVIITRCKSKLMQFTAYVIGQEIFNTPAFPDWSGLDCVTSGH